MVRAQCIVEFEMAQCVPPYLLAFAAGTIGSRDLSPRTRVYAEGGDTLQDDAAREFARVEDMVKVGESLFGPYEVGDVRSAGAAAELPQDGLPHAHNDQGGRHRVQVVAHELAHSWTGYLITNTTNEDFWLNKAAHQRWTIELPENCDQRHKGAMEDRRKECGRCEDVYHQHDLPLRPCEDVYHHLTIKAIVVRMCIIITIIQGL